jgi:hypothetical protein
LRYMSVLVPLVDYKIIVTAQKLRETNFKKHQK